MREHRLNWDDLKKLIELKTLYLSAILFLLGIAVVVVGAYAVKDQLQLILVAVGSTFITSALFSLASEAAVRIDLVEFIHDELASFSIQASPSSLGPTHTYSSRADIDWPAFLGAVEGKLIISGVSANDILSETNCRRIRDRILTNHLEELVIYLLDPQWGGMSSRAKNPAYLTEDSMTSKIRAVIADLKELETALKAAGRQSSYRLNLVQEPPTVSLVADSAMAFVTPIVRTHTGGDSVTFQFVNSGHSRVFYDFYVNHARSLGSANLATENRMAEYD